MSDFRVKDLGGYLDGLNNIFDIVRIVNPKRKEVAYQSSGGDTIANGCNCNELWDKSQVFDNCISFRSIKEKKILSKIEYNGDGVFMVMATPMIFGDDLYIVEMIKDITETMFGIDSKGMEKKN